MRTWSSSAPAGNESAAKRYAPADALVFAPFGGDLVEVDALAHRHVAQMLAVACIRRRRRSASARRCGRARRRRFPRARCGAHRRVRATPPARGAHRPRFRVPRRVRAIGSGEVLLEAAGDQRQQRDATDDGRRGQSVTRQIAPMARPARPPTSANNGKMRMAQIQPSIRISSVPSDVQDVRERRRRRSSKTSCAAISVSAMYTVTTATSTGDAEDEGLHHRRVRLAGLARMKIRRNASPASTPPSQRPPAAVWQPVFGDSSSSHADVRRRVRASARSFSARRKIGGQPDCPRRGRAAAGLTTPTSPDPIRRGAARDARSREMRGDCCASTRPW